MKIKVKARPPKVERLVSVAIIRNGTVESRGFKSHADLRRALGDADPYKHTRGDEEGFLTDTGRFLSRRAAVSVAIKSGQLGPMWASCGRDLLSSDIDW